MKYITKKCLKCGVVKTSNNFHRAKQNKDWLQSYCKECGTKVTREWQQANKETCNAIKREKYKNDPQHRIAHYGRTQISKIIQGTRKYYKFIVDCGAGSREVFMKHLISTIPAGYTIADYGTREYEHKLCVDHIIPCVRFDLTKKSEWKKCFNYKNLRLVSKQDNAHKGSK